MQPELPDVSARLGSTGRKFCLDFDLRSALGSTGWRGDARDAASGGDNVTQLPIACDVRVRAWQGG